MQICSAGKEVLRGYTNPHDDFIPPCPLLARASKQVTAELHSDNVAKTGGGGPSSVHTCCSSVGPSNIFLSLKIFG